MGDRESTWMPFRSAVDHDLRTKKKGAGGHASEGGKDAAAFFM